jgi:hypothetical protein
MDAIGPRHSQYNGSRLQPSNATNWPAVTVRDKASEDVATWP